MKRVMSFVLYVLMASWCMPAYCDVRDFGFYGEHYRLDDVSGLAFRLCDGTRMATVVSPSRLPDLRKICGVLNDSVGINNRKLKEAYDSCGVAWQNRIRSLGAESAAYMDARFAYADSLDSLLGKARTLIRAIEAIIAEDGPRTPVAGRSNSVLSVPEEFDMIFSLQQKSMEEYITRWNEIEAYVIPPLNQETIYNVVSETSRYDISRLKGFVDCYESAFAEYERLKSTGNIAKLRDLKAELEKLWYKPNALQVGYPYGSYINDAICCPWWEGFEKLCMIEDYHWTYEHHGNELCEMADYLSSMIGGLYGKVSESVAANENVFEIPAFVGDDNGVAYKVCKLEGSLFKGAGRSVADDIRVNIPESVDSICGSVFPIDNISKIYISANKPPYIDEAAFTDHVYGNAVLYVPETEYAEYAQSDWKHFRNIISYDNSGVKDIEADIVRVYGRNGVIYVESEGLVYIFDCTGRLVYEGGARAIEVGMPGIYIVKVAGKVYKIAL